MKSFFNLKFVLIFVVMCIIALNLFSCGDNTVIYNGEFLEKRLSMPYRIDGILTQDGDKYDVIVNGMTNNTGTELIDFKIEYLSGNATKGIVVEFFDNGVFLYFDDLRFKTNSELFTNLEALKTAFEKLAEPYTEKYVGDAIPVNGTDNIIEIGISTDEYGDIKVFVNKIDGTIIRLSTTLNGSDITLDIKTFENITEPQPKYTEETNPVFDVVDDVA